MSKTLAELRREKGFTQRELAEKLGLNASTIAMYETGDRTPYLDTAIKIAQLFSVPVESIIFGQKLREMRARTLTSTGTCD